MAGNTKLRGFRVGEVELERWGKRVMVRVSEDSTKNLVAACKVLLPKEPPERDGSGDIIFRYNEDTGRVGAIMSPEDARLLHDLVSRVEMSEAGLHLGGRGLLSDLKHQLNEVRKAYLDYHNKEEPGLS